MSTHSLYDQKTDLVAFEVKIGGSPINPEVQLQSITVYKTLFKLSTAKITLLDGSVPSEEFTTIEKEAYEHGKEVEISLGYHNNTTPIFKGIITKHSIKITSAGSSKIILECADENIKMTGQRKFEYFKDKKDSEIMSSLVSGQKDIESTTKKHDMVVQHNTTDWDFLIARAQANQLVVTTDAGKVIVKKPKIVSEKVKLTFGENIIDMDLAIDGRSQVKELLTHSWNPDDQKVETATAKEPTEINKHGSIKGQKIATDLKFEKTELHSTAHLDKDELQEWADSSLLLSRLSRVKGSVKTQGVEINPLDVIELKNLGKYYDGKALVTGVLHEQKDGNWITELELGFSSDLFVQQKNDITLPVSDGLLPGVHGLFVGIVKQTHGDPENRYRVLVTLPMVDGTTGDGVWARVSNIMATDKHGSWFYPEVGDEVICGALGGDIRHPVVLGHLYSKKIKAPESEFNHSDENNEKGWFTREKLLFHFNDKDKIIRIETPGGQKLKLDDKDKSITLEDQHKNKMVMDSSGFKLTGMKDFVLDVKGKVDIKAMGNVTAATNMGNFEAKGMNADLKGTINAGVSSGASSLKTGPSGATIKGVPMVMIN